MLPLDFIPSVSEYFYAVSVRDYTTLLEAVSLLLQNKCFFSEIHQLHLGSCLTVAHKKNHRDTTCLAVYMLLNVVLLFSKASYITGELPFYSESM